MAEVTDFDVVIIGGGPGGYAADLYGASVSGEIVQINESVGDTPEAINEDPYRQGWLVVRVADPSEADSLMGAEEYEATIAS